LTNLQRKGCEFVKWLGREREWPDLAFRDTPGSVPFPEARSMAKASSGSSGGLRTSVAKKSSKPPSDGCNKTIQSAGMSCEQKTAFEEKFNMYVREQLQQKHGKNSKMLTKEDMQRMVDVSENKVAQSMYHPSWHDT
jgi:hypothetical protein